MSTEERFRVQSRNQLVAEIVQLERTLTEQRPAVSAYGDAVLALDRALAIPVDDVDLEDEPGTEVGLLEGIGLLLEQRDQARATVGRLTAELERRDAGEQPLPGMPALTPDRCNTERQRLAEELAQVDGQAWEDLRTVRDRAQAFLSALDSLDGGKVTRAGQLLRQALADTERVAGQLTPMDELQAEAQDLRDEVESLRHIKAERDANAAAVRSVYRISRDILSHPFAGGSHPDHSPDCMVCGAERFRADAAAGLTRTAQDPGVTQ